MAALVESIMYVSNQENNRFVPWHGLGVAVETAPDSKTALISAGLDWKVTKKDLVVPGCSTITDYKATVRDVDNTVLGIVTDRYKIVNNDEAFSFVDNIVDGVNTLYETAGSLRNGRTVWMLARLPQFKILNEDMDQFLCFTNTHDGTGSVKAFITPVRVVCNNTLNYALESAKRSWYCTHSGNIDKKLHEAQETLFNANKYIDALKEDANTLLAKKFTQMQIAKLIMELIPDAPDNASDRQKENVSVARKKFVDCLSVSDLQNFNGTGWAIVNAASDYMTHESVVNRSPYSESRFSKVLMGNNLIDKARKLVLAA